MALIGHPLMNDPRYTYGFASQLLRSSGREARRSAAGAEGALPACSEAGADAEACVPDEAHDPDVDAESSGCSHNSQVWHAIISLLAVGCCVCLPDRRLSICLALQKSQIAVKLCCKLTGHACVHAGLVC